jgi:hypothetical protein
LAAARAARSSIFLRLGVLAGRVLYVLAWTVVILAALLFLVEESGVLVHVVRKRAAAELGPLGDGLQIGRVGLRWFEPALTIEEVSLRVTDRELREREVLHLDEVRLAIDPRPSAEQRVRLCSVLGGRLRISDELARAAERFSTWWDERPTSPDAPPPPRVQLSDFVVELELPDEGPLTLGRGRLAFEPQAEGGWRVAGTLVPLLADTIGPTNVVIDGEARGKGILLHASAHEIPVRVRKARLPSSLGALPIEELSGKLTLDVRAGLVPGARTTWSSSVRARLSEGRLLVIPGDVPILSLDVDVGAKLAPEGSMSAGALWSREAWSAVARASARWRDSPLEAGLALGRALPRGLARVWVRAERLPLAREPLDLYPALANLRDDWAALEPSGTADMTLDAEIGVRPADLDPPLAPRLAVHVHNVGSSGVTYRGYVPRAAALEAAPGVPERLGFPVPVQNLRGDIFYRVDPEARRPQAMALVGLSGSAAGGELFASGVLHAPPLVLGRVGAAGDAEGPGSREPEFDLELSTLGIALGPELRAGLAGNEGTREVWDEYGAVEGAGRVRGVVRLHGSPAAQGEVGEVDVAIEDAALAWREIPVPLQGVHGAVSVRWAAEPTPIADAPGERHRAVGVAFRLSNREGGAELPGQRALVQGFVRGETSHEPALSRADLARRLPVVGLEVAIDRLSLTDASWRTLVQELPELGALTGDLGAKGFLAARYSAVREHADAPWIDWTEAEPLELEAELTPREFQRRISKLRGRVLVRREELAGDESALDADLALAGEWPEGADVAAVGPLSTREPTLMRLVLARVDPANASLLKILSQKIRAAQGGQGAEVDLSQLDIEGFLDARIVRPVDLASEEEPALFSQVFLRDNGFANQSVRLSTLHGVLEHDGQVLRSPLIHARLAGHPVELRNVLLFRLEDAPSTRGVDADLLRSAGLSAGSALQAELHVRGLPLDEAHLASLFEAQTLGPLRANPSWHGAIDVDGARILVTSDVADQSAGRLVVSGPVRPHGLSFRLGVPIEVPSARVELERLVLEAGKVRGWARIEGLIARIAGRELSNASMTVTYVDGRLSVDDLTGEFEGGRLTSVGPSALEIGPASGGKALGVDLSEPYDFDVALRLQDVDVGRFLRGLFEASIVDQGRLDLELELRGTPGEVLGLTGSGRLKLDRARLWSIPVMRALFGQLGFDETAIFDSMLASFQIRGGRVLASPVEVRSRLLDLIGAGTLDFDGALRFDLEVAYGLLYRLGPISRVLYWLNNSLWRVAVRGDMSRPIVTVRNRFLELLKGFEDRPPRALPTPGFAPLSKRF